MLQNSINIQSHLTTVHNNKGHVALVGAGPGDPELLTIKALRLLQSADVVLTDRLVSPVIVEEYVSKDAEVVYVGKQCRRGASTPQHTINEVMVSYALEGKRVVRLKGGDVSIFSNILDELEALVEAQISYEIVPGVTAALGAAAYSGIPLTARERSTAVRFLTYYKSTVVADTYWAELAQTSDTLVFYMSAETVGGVVSKLLQHGADEEIEMALIEQATTPLQQIHTCKLKDFHVKLDGAKWKSPSLVIIGKVVGLHHQFGWKANINTDEEYFQPVQPLLTTLASESARA